MIVFSLSRDIDVADIIVINKADCLGEGLIDEPREILSLSVRDTIPTILATALNNYGLKSSGRSWQSNVPSLC